MFFINKVHPADNLRNQKMWAFQEKHPAALWIFGHLTGIYYKRKRRHRFKICKELIDSRNERKINVALQLMHEATMEDFNWFFHVENL